MDENSNNGHLPYHKLIAYDVARQLVVAVVGAHIRDSGLRDQAVRAAQSAMLNCAEGAGRVSRADKARAFAIARGETVEAGAAVDVAAACGDASPEAAAEVQRLAARLYAMLTPLARAP
jgi:four helix bundle protein